MLWLLLLICCDLSFSTPNGHWIKGLDRQRGDGRRTQEVVEPQVEPDSYKSTEAQERQRLLPYEPTDSFVGEAESPKPPNFNYATAPAGFVPVHGGLFNTWWKWYCRFCGYQGNQAVGRSEFPFLVYIYPADADLTKSREYWATGGLLTPVHVLTACRVARIIDLDCASDKQYFCNECKNADFDIYAAMTTTYLFERYRRYGEDQEIIFDWDDYGKTRLIERFISHPQCTETTVDKDAAIAVLQQAFQPFPPIISVIPWARDQRLNVITSLDVRNMEHTLMVCLVASFGRTYFNNEFFPLRDYKMKTRAYYIPWAKCRKYWSDMCRCPREPLCKNPLQNVETEHLFCMETRSRVGAICDHDRGSMVACHGEVFGMVVAGASLPRCNNQISFPFVVLGLAGISDFINQFEEGNVNLYHVDPGHAAAAVADAVEFLG